MVPLLSLVTGTLDRPGSLKRLIASVQKHTTVPWELIVSDASEKPALEVMPLNIKVLLERPRKGFTKGYNHALTHCQGRWVIWLNDDAEVLPGYAEKAIEFMECHPKIGLGALSWADNGGSSFKVSMHWGMPYANFGIISRDLGNQVGWFDEDFEMYGSDNSLTFRVLMAGKGVMGVPGQFIRHHRIQDAHRIANQKNRIIEAQRLADKYTRYQAGIVANYKAALR